MTKDELIFELTGTLNDVIDFIDDNEEKAKKIYSESQLDFVEKIWFSCDDLKEATYEELEEWFEKLDDMHYMY